MREVLRAVRRRTAGLDAWYVPAVAATLAALAVMAVVAAVLLADALVTTGIADA